MSKTIIQRVVFKDTAAEDLYNLYMDAKKHSIISGANAEIGENEGDEFSYHDKYIFGKHLKINKNKLIVQTWRATDWKQTDEDSILILHFESRNEDTVVNMIQSNVPDDQAESLEEGWRSYYWKPWKKFLAGKFKPAE